MRYIIYIIFIVFYSCSQRQTYTINVFGDYVNITKEVKEKIFIPIAVNGKTDTVSKFINTHFLEVTKDESEIILDSLKINNHKLIEKVTYKYSYVILDKPIDVFLIIGLNSRNTMDTLYIRKENDELIFPISQEDWVK